MATNTKTIEAANKVVDAAGAAGGLDEVRRIAARGWPADVALDGDCPELRAAIHVEAARRAYVACCEEIGSNAISEENAILQVGSDFLPECARVVLDGGDPTPAYYDWLTSETCAAQIEDDAGILPPLQSENEHALDELAGELENPGEPDGETDLANPTESGPIHTSDADCTVFDNGCCAACGVLHGDPCALCGGKGFHDAQCAEVAS